MKIRARLIGMGGELDSHSIEIRDDDDSAEISEQIHDVIDEWILAPGDTIKIEQV